MKRIFIISLLVFAASLRTVAADYHFRHFTKENGSLPYDAVRVLYEDSRGHIWIGTQNGLSVFDGKRFKIFDRSQFGVESDYVSSIAEAAGGDIWVGTDKGIVVYDIESGGFRTLPGSLVQSRVYAMQRDTSGIIWIGVNGRGLFKAKEDEVTRIPNLDISDVYRIAINKDGSLVLASYCNNIFTYDPSAGSESLRPVANGAFFKDDVEGIVADSNGCLYIASKSRGLVKLELKTGRIETLLLLNPNQRPTNLSMSGNSLLMSTTGGLVLYDIHSQEKKIISSDPEDPFSIGSDFVRDACFTKDGALVIGQENSGVSYHHPLDDRFKKYYYGMSGSVVQGFAQTSDSTLWIVTQRSGLMQLSKDGFLTKYSSGAKLPDNLTAVCADGNTLWLGEQRGVLHLDLRTDEHHFYGTLGKSDKTVDNRVVSIFRSSCGDIYVGAATGVVRYDPASDTFIAIDGLNVAVEDFKEDANGDIWMASYSKGAILYSPESETVSYFGTLYGNAPIQEMTSSVCIDSDGYVWILGFSSGLYKYLSSSSRFESINRDNCPQLPTNLYYTGLSDSRGTLWLSTDSGLVHFDPKNDGVRLYTVNEGLISDSFKKSGLVLMDGTMVFGNQNGFIRFNPLDFELPKAPVKQAQPFLKTTLGIILLTILFSLLLAAIVSFILYKRFQIRQKRRKKEQEIENARRAYEEKLNFFSGVIHEIRTPLTLIRTPLDNLLSDNSVGRSEMRDLKTIDKSAKYLDGLVKELLDFIREEERGHVMEFAETDIRERIKFFKSTFAELAKERDLKLSFHDDKQPIVTAVDVKAFDKIVNNLLDNAVKYAESYVRITLNSNEENFTLRFENDGAVIPKNHREAIFEAFVRCNDKKQFAKQGFGIGLAFARRLVQQHGGNLKMSDRMDVNEFILTIPLKKLESQPDIQDAQEIGAPSMPLVLIVEDNIDLNAYLKRKLKEVYRVISAQTAEKALELLKSKKVDLVLTDIGLNGMSGVELCRTIAADENLAHIPIIVISAISSVDVKIKCVESGAAAYIEKPFSLDYLFACIKGVFDKRESIKASAAPVSESAPIVLANRDADFIKALDELIAKNISNPEFSNKDMKRELLVSHSSLSRRMNALLGQTPNEYLRNKRMEEAARLLSESSSALVADVCYAVGFNSPSYFAKRFKEHFGISPLEYQKQKSG